MEDQRKRIGEAKTLRTLIPSSRVKGTVSVCPRHHVSTLLAGFAYKRIDAEVRTVVPSLAPCQTWFSVQT